MRKSQLIVSALVLIFLGYYLSHSGNDLFALVKKYPWILSIFSIGSITSIIIFYYRDKPDLKIPINDVGGPDWNNLEYHFNIKNYGRSMADNVEVNLDLDYWKGQTEILKQLPSGESYTFTFQAALQMPATLPNPFLDNVKKILSGEKAGVATITIKYKWGLKKFQCEYHVVIRRDGLWVHQI